MRETDYGYLNKSAESLIKGVPHLIANLANISALIYSELEDINWAGFYLSEGEMLVLGPFQGKTACIEIPYGRGVCGTMMREGLSANCSSAVALTRIIFGLMTSRRTSLASPDCTFTVT